MRAMRSIKPGEILVIASRALRAPTGETRRLPNPANIEKIGSTPFVVALLTQADKNRWTP